MACPLCRSDPSGPSWLGSTFYRGRQFDYIQCHCCGTLYCDPMPDHETLAQMYGLGYSESFHEDPHVVDPKQPHRTIEWLGKTGKGTFIDYGCGDGSLLGEAAELGWQTYGVEFDPEVAGRAEGKTGLKIFSDPSALLNEAGGPADVLHLGDVIEHLTALDRQMPEILGLLKPGGILLAQGPLEGNPNLFLMFLRLSRSIRKAQAVRDGPVSRPARHRRGTKDVFSSVRARGIRILDPRGLVASPEQDLRGRLRPTSSAWLVRSASALPVGLQVAPRQARQSVLLCWPQEGMMIAIRSISELGCPCGRRSIMDASGGLMLLRRRQRLVRTAQRPVRGGLEPTGLAVTQEAE